MNFGQKDNKNSKIRFVICKPNPSMRLKFLFFWLAFFIAFNLLSQSGLSIGEWKSHLSYKDGKRVAQGPENVWYASSRGLISVFKEDLSVKFLSKEDGLSDVRISNLYYDPYNDQLILVYVDNNIDIIKDDEIYNIPFISNNTSIAGGKNVNDIFISDFQEAFLATDFGILGFNTQKLEFPFTTFTDLKVSSVAYLNGTVYAGTEEGLYAAKPNEVNVSDFGSWQHLGTSSGLPSNEVEFLAVKFGKIFAAITGKVYASSADGSFGLLFSAGAEEKIKWLSEDGSALMIGLENDKNETRTMFYNADGTWKEQGKGCINKGSYSLEDQKGRVWYADQWDPVRYTEGGVPGTCKNLKFEVPYTNDASNVRFRKEKAYFGSGGVTEDFQYRFTLYGFYTLEEGVWKNFNADNLQALRDNEFLHLYTLAPNPKKQEIFLGSYYNGIILYDEETGTISHWNKNNSILQGIVGDEARTRIAGLALDKDQMLWICNYGAPKPLAVRTPENIWYNFSVPGNTTLTDIVIDNQGNKWIAVSGAGGGLLVFNEGDKLDDTSDDKARYISRNNSEITGNKVNCVTMDLDGSIWVGTDQGPVVFDCGDPFNESCRGNIRKVVVDNIPALLLRDEDVLTIEADGGNRKWFGTRNGIFVQSPDGTAQEAKYDVKNSPLLSNKVQDLGFNAVTGEMFVITDLGIQSVRTETTGGGRSHSSSVYAFPNPVRPDYNGPIAIKGLVRDASVKITDINGKLVYQTRALGGQAIWDGKDYNGVMAATGVYLVFSANENTSTPSDAYVTKILVIR